MSAYPYKGIKGYKAMLWGITGADAGDHAELFENIWRFRHQHFVERFGWEALRQADGREIDAFDDEHAVHLPLVHDNHVVGYTRLLRTDKPHLLSDIYPELMDGLDWPKGRHIYEWTRCVAEIGGLTIAGVPVSHMLMTGVMEYCLITGIQSLIVETHPKLVNLLMTTGWQVKPLSAPSILNDVPVLPIEAVPSAKGLLKHHELYQINGSVVDFHKSSSNPLNPAEALRMLPYLDGFHGQGDMQRLAGE